MNPLIEFCEQNLDRGSRWLVTDSQLTSVADIFVESCLSECKFCRQHYFALFEGKKISGGTPEELKAALLTGIAEWQQEYDV